MKHFPFSLLWVCWVSGEMSQMYCACDLGISQELNQWKFVIELNVINYTIPYNLEVRLVVFVYCIVIEKFEEY